MESNPAAHQSSNSMPRVWTSHACIPGITPLLSPTASQGPHIIALSQPPQIDQESDSFRSASNSPAHFWISWRGLNCRLVFSSFSVRVRNQLVALQTGTNSTGKHWTELNPQDYACSAHLFRDVCCSAPKMKTGPRWSSYMQLWRLGLLESPWDSWMFPALQVCFRWPQLDQLLVSLHILHAYFETPTRHLGATGQLSGFCNSKVAFWGSKGGWSSQISWKLHRHRPQIACMAVWKSLRGDKKGDKKAAAATAEILLGDRRVDNGGQRHGRQEGRRSWDTRRETSCGELS